MIEGHLVISASLCDLDIPERDLGNLIRGSRDSRWIFWCFFGDDQTDVLQLVYAIQSASDELRVCEPGRFVVEGGPEDCRTVKAVEKK